MAMPRKQDAYTLQGQINKYQQGKLGAASILDMYKGLVLTGLIKTMPKPYRDVADILIKNNVIKQLHAANDN